MRTSSQIIRAPAPTGMAISSGGTGRVFVGGTSLLAGIHGSLFEAVDIISSSWHHLDMRTTLAIDDAVLGQVKRLAESRSQSLGKTASNLLRRALEAECPTIRAHGLTVLDPGSHSAVVASSTVRDLVEEGM